MRALASRAVQRSASVAIALFAGLMCYVSDDWLYTSRVVVVAGALAGFAGAMFGTVFAAASLLISGGNKRLIHNMRMTGHLQRLSGELLTSAILWLLAALLCVLALLFDAEASRAIFSAGVATTLLALLATVAVGRKMALVLLFWGDD